MRRALWLALPLLLSGIGPAVDAAGAAPGQSARESALKSARTSAGGSEDSAAGELLAAGCAGCHRQAATGPGGIPSLSGLTATEIAEKLSAYRSGELQGTLMNRLARGYTEAEIWQLAAALGEPSE